MIGKLVSLIVIGIALFALWKYFDGNLGLALTTAWNIFYNIIDAGSDVVIDALNSFSG